MYTHLKKLLFVAFSVLLFATKSFAATNQSSVTTNNNDDSDASSQTQNSSAQQPVKPTNSDFNHFFINGAFGAGGSDMNTNSPNASFGPAYSLNFGYNFNETMAIEAGYTQMDGMNITSYALSPFTGISSTLQYSIFDVAFRPTLHLSNYFSFYGKLGGAIENATWNNTSFSSSLWDGSPPGPNTTSFGALIGGGASVDFGPISLFLELDQFIAISGSDSATPADYFSSMLGVQYNF